MDENNTHQELVECYETEILEPEEESSFDFSWKSAAMGAIIVGAGAAAWAFIKNRKKKKDETEDKEESKREANNETNEDEK